MSKSNIPLRLLTLSALLLTLSACTTPLEEGEHVAGYLCCNMATNGTWISDLNTQLPTTTLYKAGTPVTVTGYGKHSIRIIIDGKEQWLGNDYGRKKFTTQAFSKRYILSVNPMIDVATFEPKIQKAVRSARLVKGMTRAQVVTSIGYPVPSENPFPDSSVWHYWPWNDAKATVVFDEAGIVTEIHTDMVSRRLLVID